MPLPEECPGHGQSAIFLDVDVVACQEEGFLWATRPATDGAGNDEGDARWKS